ncbi:YcaO-like family protein [Pseudomonas sp. CGJS7]|uniref:YcaO-like family protein n=1 Tax=Pseudomonas sp. CGJS7 TaxID=3109348 RepID=UPI00300A2595
MIPYERERSLDHANRVIRDCVQRRGWTLETEDMGGHLITVKCTLRDAGGELISRGFGKGEAAVSLTGALYEAMEHHYCKFAHTATPVQYLPAERIAQDPRNAGLPFLSAFADNAGRAIACRSYRSYSGGEALAVPLFLTFPEYPVAAAPDARDDFDYGSVTRFSSNSGTAIGASFEEAALHGIAEIVERDAWSLFLIAHYLAGAGRYGRLIEPASLPEEAARVHRLAERRLGRRVLLIEITSDLGLPVFIATTEQRLPGEVVFPHGCGASPYPQYAAIRALSELTQCVDIKESSGHLAELDQLALDMLADYPKLRDCAMFRIDPERLERVEWPHPDKPRLAPKQLLPVLVRELESRGIGLYHAINHREGEDFCVVSSVSPELERFFLATTGILMAPGRRGSEFLRRQREAAAEREPLLAQEA